MGSATSTTIKIILIVLNLFLLVASINSKIGCRDMDGNFTPWYYVYKLPKLAGDKDPNFEAGLGYYYLGPDTKDWVKSYFISMNDSTSVIGHTLADLYKKENSDHVAYLAYNDHPPGQPKSRINGHSKGILITDINGGLWLQHSVPQFPKLNINEYEFQAAETGRGQIFICISLSTAQIDNISADVMKSIRPMIFAHSIPPLFDNILPKLRNSIKKQSKRNQKRAEETLPKRIFKMAVDQLEFSVFVKTPEFEQEMFTDWMAPKFETSLAVQTWLERPDRLKSNCTPLYEVHNVNTTGFGSQHFSAAKDHSKWAVSLNESKPWTCIADLNRRWGQRFRGGLAICTLDSKIWSAFRKIVIQTEQCKAKKRTNYWEGYQVC